MRAIITVSLKTMSPEEAQKLLNDMLSKLRSEGMIDNFSFEIEAGSGVVTEKCILSDGKVVA
ncbi:MAG: hypothetical protein P8Z71_01340 [Candidatus Sulfobium sp.]|jgi:hypothetical protein